MDNTQSFFDNEPVAKNGLNYYVIPANTSLFRGDIPKDYNNPLKDINGPVFFGDNVDTAKQYGLPFEFKTINEIEVLALDKSMKTVHNNAPDEIQSILKKNYGYPKGNRDSDDKADKQLTDYICNKYGSYALNYMPTDAGGIFHREIVLCDKEQVKFEKMVPIRKEEENTIIDNQKLRRAEQNRLDQKKRPRRDSKDNINNLTTALFNKKEDERDEEDNKPNSFPVYKVSFDDDDEGYKTPGGKRQQHKKKTMRRNKKNSKKRSYRRKTNKRSTRRNNSKRHIKKYNRTQRK